MDFGYVLELQPRQRLVCLKRIVVLAMLTRVRFEFIILNSLKFSLEISRLDCFSFVAKMTSRLLRKFSTDYPYI